MQEASEPELKAYARNQPSVDTGAFLIYLSIMNKISTL